MKARRSELGELEIRFFGYVQLRKKDVIRTGELVDALGITPKQERELLSRMARRQLIVRLKRGVYLAPQRIPPGGLFGGDEYLILNRLMEEIGGKYQISGPNAFNIYGFSEQVPNRTYAYNNRLSGDRTIGRLQFTFIKTGDQRLGATRTMTTSMAILSFGHQRRARCWTPCMTGRGSTRSLASIVGSERQ